jgi:hypothetical protein
LVKGESPSGSFPQFAQNRRSLATLDKMIPFVDTPSTIGAGLGFMWSASTMVHARTPHRELAEDGAERERVFPLLQHRWPQSGQACF